MSLRVFLFSLLLLPGLLACTTTPPAGKMIDGHLRPCPHRPNCVTSDSTASDSVAPISFNGSPEVAWQRMQTILQDLGGVIEADQSTYLWATFTSPLLHFVDDLELRMDPGEKRIHIRSGARVGFSDLGVNGRRVTTIRQRFAEQPSGTPAGSTR